MTVILPQWQSYCQQGFAAGRSFYRGAMTMWGEFAAEAPELAGEGRRRFDASGLILLGTVRRDGHPRLSPVEPIITDGQLYLGMIHRSTKALDLPASPVAWCTTRSPVVTGRTGSSRSTGTVDRSRTPTSVSATASRSRSHRVAARRGVRPLRHRHRPGRLRDLRRREADHEGVAARPGGPGVRDDAVARAGTAGSVKASNTQVIA